MTNKHKFDCYLMNFFTAGKNFLVYETKYKKIIKFKTATKSKVVARLSNKKYQEFIDDLEEKFGDNAFSNIATFNYLCEKFNIEAID